MAFSPKVSRVFFKEKGKGKETENEYKYKYVKMNREKEKKEAFSMATVPLACAQL